MTAAWSVDELYPFPCFCQAMSYEQGILMQPRSSAFTPFLMAAFLSSDIAVLQLFFVTCSTACPILFSLLLKVTGFIKGIFNVHSKLFRWVSPISVCRHWRAALELSSWLIGPLWLLLCSLEVLTTFSVPHTAQVTENTEANPYFFSAVIFHHDKLAENKVIILILRKIR